MTTSSPTPKRCPGAPRGNKNRYLHGRYARRPELTVPPEPAEQSEQTSPPRRLTIAHEIALLRACMFRTAMIGALTVDLDRTREVLHTLSLASTALTRLIHAEDWLSQSTGLQVQVDELPVAIAQMEHMSKIVLKDLKHRSLPPPSSLPVPESIVAHVDRCLADLPLDLADLLSDPVTPDPQPPVDSSAVASDDPPAGLSDDPLTDLSDDPQALLERLSRISSSVSLEPPD